MPRPRVAYTAMVGPDQGPAARSSRSYETSSLLGASLLPKEREQRDDSSANPALATD